MRRRLWVELPPITETWKEASALHRPTPTYYAPTLLREYQAERVLKDVRYLVSLEEVFGVGLLARFELARTRATAHDLLLERLRLEALGGARG